jgi:predicted GIY-YIG superfamily endonuclease
VVYWIFETQKPGVPVYVGCTQNLLRRWREHNSDSEQLAVYADRSILSIRVVETVVGTIEDGKNAEQRHIAAGRSINPFLLNRTI